MYAHSSIIPRMQNIHTVRIFLSKTPIFYIGFFHISLYNTIQMYHRGEHVSIYPMGDEPMALVDAHTAVLFIGHIQRVI